MLRTGRRTYPRYFKLDFAFNRARYVIQPRPIDPERAELQQQVIQLRLRGWSFPAIAKQLNISIGTAWNMAKRKI
ncbi:MAG: response regulator transcription factor [Anaerolineae bacterium]|nr:response regulator transcription factor [Anaerolineae bacterium]